MKKTVRIKSGLINGCFWIGSQIKIIFQRYYDPLLSPKPMTVGLLTSQSFLHIRNPNGGSICTVSNGVSGIF